MTGSGAVVIDGCYVACADEAGREFPAGHVVAQDGRIAAVGAGPADAGRWPGATRIDGADLIPANTLA